MWKVVLAIVVANAAVANAQPRHIQGVVADQDGKPIDGAGIYAAGDIFGQVQTNAGGVFALDTGTSLMVARKVGFTSKVVRFTDASEILVTLQALTDQRTLPACSGDGRYEGIEGWSASLRFPRVPGVKASKQGHDIDYGSRRYYLDTKPKHSGIVHGSGPSWSLGVPSGFYVRGSVEYEEVIFEAGGTVIADARGTFADGKRWRYLGMVGEAASYSGVDAAEAEALDRVLDGACLNLVRPAKVTARPGR